MPRSCFRSLAAFVLILALAASWAVAGEPRFRPASQAAAEPAAAGFFSNLWSLMTALWNGCSIDPNGHCLDFGEATSSQTDNGCSLDPDGRCPSGS